jgi:DNA-binding NarL/FixJ family response regulator
MKPLRILIVDDHEVVRQGIRALLGRHGDWKIIGEAATGCEAVEKTRKLRPDLVLLDITMPGLDGVHAIPLIMEAYSKAKILVLTMHESGEIAAKVLAAGASGMVLKSDAARDLIRAVQAIEKKQPFLSPSVTQAIVDEMTKPSALEPLPADLSPREREVLELLANGLANREVAAALGISVKTAAAHRGNIMRKLKLLSYGELIHFAIRHGLVEVRRA